MRSRDLESSLQEARWLAQQGVTELILVAQDVTSYGDDTGQNQLCRLLRELDAIEGLRWIRMLYLYPEKITRELLETIRDSQKILPYIDMPIQHIEDEILTSMRRKGDRQTIQNAVALIREILPGATLRTSLIAGYPGETEKQFETLCRFVQQTKFDRLGCFAYSEEENTPAAGLPGQIPKEERERRAGIIMEQQGRIMAEKQQKLVGSRQLCVCDGYDELENAYLCRTAADAPEIDANLLLYAAPTLKPGDFFFAKVTSAEGLDLVGTYEKPVQEEALPDDITQGGTQ